METHTHHKAGTLIEAGPRGRLYVNLGAAPGAGKTYAMLAEGQRLCDGGVDVVVGLAETHGRADTEAMLAALERFPRREVSYARFSHSSVSHANERCSRR